MSIASVVTEGFGPGATIALVVTSGYGLGEAVVVEPAQPQPAQGGGGSIPSRSQRKRLSRQERRKAGSGRWVRVDGDDEARELVAAIEREQAKLKTPRLVHEVVEVAAAEPVRVKTKSVAVLEQETVRVRGRAQVEVHTLAITIVEQDVIAIQGAVLVEVHSRDVAIVDRGPLETANVVLSAEVEQLRAQVAALKAQSAKSDRDRQALEVLLLAA